MELILNREHTMKAVTIAAKFAESAAGPKVLQGVCLSAEGGRVRLTTTDLALWCQVDLAAQTPQPGTVLVPARTLGKVLKSLPHGRVTLTNDGDDVTLAAGPSEVRVSGIESDDYPEIDPPGGRLVSMPLHASLVDSVAYAVSKDPTRYTLAGVCLEVGTAGLKLVATDGHRLARHAAASLPPGSVVDVDLEEPVSGIIPVRLLAEGVRLAGQLDGTAMLELYEKAAAVRVNGSVVISSGLIEGQYPAYERIVPSEHAGCGNDVERHAGQRRFPPRGPREGPPGGERPPGARRRADGAQARRGRRRRRLCGGAPLSLRHPGKRAGMPAQSRVPA